MEIAKAVILAHSTLSGEWTTLDGVPLVDGDVVLAVAQNDPVYNGLYIVRTGAWERGADTFDYKPGMEVRIIEGNDYEMFKYVLNVPFVDVIVDTTSQVWQVDSTGRAPKSGLGTEIQPDGSVDLAETGVLAGEYQAAVQVVDSTGRVVDIYGGETGTAYMEGLEMKNVGTTQVQIDPGAAYIPGIARIVFLEESITLPKLNNTSHAVYFAYLYETNGVGQIEFSTTMPDTAYFGTARTKTGDTTRRYLGMIKNDFIGNVLEFEMEDMGGGSALYVYGALHNSDRVWATTSSGLSFGAGTNNVHNIGANADSDFKKMLSPAARVWWGNCNKNSGGGELYIGWPLDAIYQRPPFFMNSNQSFVQTTPMLRCSPNQEVYLRAFNASVSGVYLGVLGYIERR